MRKTKIEYLDYTWNPITMRCTPCSPGCANCWHLRTCDRLAKNPTINPIHQSAYEGKNIALKSKELEAPLSLKSSLCIGVQFMGDLFHESIQFKLIEEIFDVIRQPKLHDYFILTKRPQQVLKFWKWRKSKYLSAKQNSIWPDNAWMGITICNQAEADEKIPILLQLPAAVRWLSVEPMLESVLIKWWLDGNHEFGNKPDWVVCGAETGPGARPMQLEWARDLLRQCRSAGVPFFMKQVDAKKSPMPDDLMVREYPE